MSAATFSMADQFLRWRDGRASNWMRLYEVGKARRGLMETASLDDIVTDSAAAASAFGCGRRVNNRSLNIGPAGEEYEPILVTAKNAGKATGLVTTAIAVHATPAGFAVNVPHRGSYPEIAGQYFERKFDIILGGGRELFDGKAPDFPESRDLTKEFLGAGYQIAGTAEELRKAAAHDAPILGLFPDTGPNSYHLPYEIDRLNDENLKKNVPSLAEMTTLTLEYLNRKPGGFVVQIEGARVDHGGHSNDIAGLLFDQVAFDEAIGAVEAFTVENPDTLVIITTDHGTGNPGLCSGRDGGAAAFSAIGGMKGSFEKILPRLDADCSVKDIRKIVAEVSGVRLDDRSAELLQTRLRETDEQQRLTPFARMNTISGVLGQALASSVEVGWVSNSHTSDHVEIAAFGPGSEQLKAFQKNTDLHAMMTQAMGIAAV